MPKYISEKRLKEIAEGFDRQNREYACVVRSIISECQELNSWMTLEEFLNSGFKGLCWIEFPSEIITDAYFDGHLFKHSSTSDFAHDENYITRVQPIHKPEPPR